MSYGFNRYISNCRISHGGGTASFTCILGTAKFDYRALMQPCFITRAECGRPHEMVLRVGGVTYYPTIDRGYVGLESC